MGTQPTALLVAKETETGKLFPFRFLSFVLARNIYSLALVHFGTLGRYSMRTDYCIAFILIWSYVLVNAGKFRHGAKRANLREMLRIHARELQPAA